jgi:hypothetical protein
MEPEKKKNVDPTLALWNEIIGEMRTCANKALALLASRELDGDPNEGMLTNVTVSLLFLPVLTQRCHGAWIQVDTAVVLG